MAEEIKKPKTKRELIECDPDTLTNDELDRRAKFIEIEAREASLEMTRRQNAQFQMKDQEVKDRYTSRGRELKKTSRDNELQQSACNHRKGRKNSSITGQSSMYSIIQHTFPWGETMITCSHCHKTWRPPFKASYDLTKPEGQLAYQQAQLAYDTAMSWPTDNSPSGSHQFAFKSDDQNVSAEQFVHDVTANITLR